MVGEITLAAASLLWLSSCLSLCSIWFFLVCCNVVQFFLVCSCPLFTSVESRGDNLRSGLSFVVIILSLLVWFFGVSLFVSFTLFLACLSLSGCCFGDSSCPPLCGFFLVSSCLGVVFGFSPIFQNSYIICFTASLPVCCPKSKAAVHFAWYGSWNRDAVILNATTTSTTSPSFSITFYLSWERKKARAEGKV